MTFSQLEERIPVTKVHEMTVNEMTVMKYFLDRQLPATKILDYFSILGYKITWR